MAHKVKKTSPKVIRRGRTASSRISSKNQVTIPVEILREIGFKSGDFVNFLIDGKRQITLIKTDEPHWKSNMRQLIGSEPGLGERCDYKREREKWDAKLTRRG
jgi:bifunctional DNA-binding transcriptional regulator/antitoxin component of YhaV-PrlF toxin-antitoxin module